MPVGLDDIEAVRLGQSTPAFAFNDAPRELALASFSIVYDEFKGAKGKGSLTCLDFVATEVRDFEVWTQAVKMLAAMANRRVDLSKITALPVEVTVQSSPADEKSAPAPTATATAGSGGSSSSGSGGSGGVSGSAVAGPTMIHYHDLIADKVAPLSKLGYITPSFAVRDLLYAHPPPLAHAVSVPERKARKIDALPFLLGGSYLIKYATHASGGPPDFRKFFLTASRDVIYWQSQSANKTVFDSRIDLDDVNDIWFGQSTPMFTKHDAPRDVAPFSFSIIYSGRTKSLDLIAPTSDEFEAWTEGIIQLRRLCKIQSAAAASVAGTIGTPTATALAAATPAPTAAPAGGGGAATASTAAPAAPAGSSVTALKDLKHLYLSFPASETDEMNTAAAFERAFGAVPRSSFGASY